MLARIALFLLLASPAAAEPDRLAARLVVFIRLLDAGQARAAEIAGFMADNPGWPDAPVLERRYAEALVDEADGSAAAGLCRAHPPHFAPALLRCAEAYALLRDPARAGQAARGAWTLGLDTPDEEAAFLGRWGAVLTPADQRARFDRQEAAAPAAAAAARQAARLDSHYAPVALARLALRQDRPEALASLAAVPAEQRADPLLLLAEARFLRRSHADQAALALWRSAMPAAEAAAPAARRAAFWGERDALARRLLADGDATSAYSLADDGTLGAEQRAEADFLAGWIALRKLHDPVRARAHFLSVAGLSRSAISQARAHYWLARAAPDAAGARAAYAEAAAWPLTYYGQLAAQAGGLSQDALRARINGLRDPDASSAEQRAFAASEFSRAADILAGWQNKRLAADFLLQAIQPPATPAVRALAAAQARRLGLDDVAVQAARLAGREGAALPRSGWPSPVTPPVGEVSPALALGVMRQESSFDPQIVSKAGAQGLMQLMPATAVQVARGLHAPAAPLADPDVNMRLGTAYLASLLGRYHNTKPFAVAAYNAGARRVDEWIAANGEAGGDADAVIDWIELIPFAETRNYVQRVLENEVIYAAHKAAGLQEGVQ